MREKSKLILMHCLKPGCPRTRRVPLDPKYDPPNTEHIVINCPWHENVGDKEEEIRRYDKKWKPLYPLDGTEDKKYV